MAFFCSVMLLMASWSSVHKSFTVAASSSLRGPVDEKIFADKATVVNGVATRQLTDEADSFKTELSPSKRIINGQNAPPDRFPWFVRTLGTPDANGVMGACGGSLIALDMVLSAAHCE
jgi:hypothetical protein